jgi:hypothetical protein
MFGRSLINTSLATIMLAASLTISASSCGDSDASSSPDPGSTNDGGVVQEGGGGGTDGSSGGQEAGTNESSGVVTPGEGGTITFGTASVQVPPGAVATPTTITIRAIDPSAVAGIPTGRKAVGPMVALLPHGLTFAQPVTVTLGHTAGTTVPASSLSVLSLENEQDTTWETLVGPTFTATTATFQTTKFCVKVPSSEDATRLYLDPGPDKVGHIALGGGKLFYSRANLASVNAVVDVRSIAIGGGSPAAVSSFALQDSTTNAMLTNATTLFFAAGQSMYSVPIAGGATSAPAAIPCAAGNFDANLKYGIPRLVADATRMYCTTIGNSAIGELRSFGFDLVPVATLANLQAPSTLAIDGDDLLYSAFGGLFRVPKALAAGTAMNIIASSELGTAASIHGIVHDATHIYIATTNTAKKGVIWRKPRAGGAIEPVTAQLDAAEAGLRSLTLVDSTLYFALSAPAANPTTQNSTLHKIAKTANAGMPTPMGGANQSNIATDGTYIYYGNGMEILRLPK